MDSASRRGQLKALDKISYGLGNITYSLPHQIIASFFLFYATAILKMPAPAAGLIMSISALWDGLSDPLMGYLSDRTQSRSLGRRHPYLLLGTLLLAVLNYCLWSLDPQSSWMTDFWTVLALVLLTKSALTIYIVPYNALGAELSTDYHERSSIQSYRAAFYLLGMFVAIVVTQVYFFRSTPAFDRGQLNPAAYPSIGGTFSLVLLAVGLLSFLRTKRFTAFLPHSSASAHRGGVLPELWGDFRRAIKNRDFFAMFLMIFIIEVGFQLGIAVGVHINTFTYNLPGPIIGLLGVIVFTSSILSQPFWVWLTRRRGKRNALFVATGIAMFGILGSPWTHIWWELFPLDLKTLPYTLGMFMLFIGFGNGAFMSIPYSMVADSVDAQEVVTGTRDEGLFFGLYTFAYKIGTSISLMLSGVFLTIVGFDAQLSTQSEQTRFWLSMGPSLYFLSITPFAILALLRYSITLKKYEEIQKILNDKRDRSTTAG